MNIRLDIIIIALGIIMFQFSRLLTLVTNYVNAEYVNEEDKETPLDLHPIAKPSNAYKNNELFKKE